MNKMLTLAAMLVVASSPAFAADEVAKTTTTTTVTSTAVSNAELQDGTKLEIAGDNVSIVAADGTKTPAPDGKHVLKDGTSIDVKNGKKLSH